MASVRKFQKRALLHYYENIKYCPQAMIKIAGILLFIHHRHY